MTYFSWLIVMLSVLTALTSLVVGRAVTDRRQRRIKAQIQQETRAALRAIGDMKPPAPPTCICGVGAMEAAVCPLHSVPPEPKFCAYHTPLGRKCSCQR